MFNLAIVAFNSPIQDSSQFELHALLLRLGRTIWLVECIKNTLPSSPDGFFNGHSAKRDAVALFLKGGTMII